MKHNHYGYTPPYMHKPLPTLGKEKEQKQIEFFEKLSGELIFSRVTKNVKIIYITHPTGQVLKKQAYTLQSFKLKIYTFNVQCSLVLSKKTSLRPSYHAHILFYKKASLRDSISKTCILHNDSNISNLGWFRVKHHLPSLIRKL